MNKLVTLGGGLAGAGALTLVHEVSKKISPDAPRLDLLGMNALAKVARKANAYVPSEGKLFGISMASDLVSNALYYSLAGSGSKKSVWIKGALLGLGAGAGAILIPQHTDLPEEHTSATPQRKALTVAFYLLGGLVAAAAINLLRGDDGLKPEQLLKKGKRSLKNL